MTITLQGFSNTSWARTLNTTLADYLREEENAIVRNYQMLALLQAQGRITTNQSGEGIVWQVRFDDHPIEANNGETTRQYQRRNLWKTAALPYRGYQVTDGFSNKEMLANRGTPAVVNLLNGFMERLTTSLKTGMKTAPYADGEATGFTDGWHGIESFFGLNGTLNSSTGAQRSSNAADYVGYPSDTYANLDTTLGAYGGDQESGAVWPDGICDPSFDFWSPLVVNYTCTGFNGTADTWEAQGDEAMRYGIMHSARNNMAEDQVTNVWITREMHRKFRNLIDGKEQIYVQRNSPVGLVALGFTNVINYDGVDVSFENAIPVNVGYGMNINSIELRSMWGQLFYPEGPTYDQDDQMHKAVVSTLSNLRFKSPRNYFKLAALA